MPHLDIIINISKDLDIRNIVKELEGKKTKLFLDKELDSRIKCRATWLVDGTWIQSSFKTTPTTKRA